MQNSTVSSTGAKRLASLVMQASLRDRKLRIGMPAVAAKTFDTSSAVNANDGRSDEFADVSPSSQRWRLAPPPPPTPPSV